MRSITSIIVHRAENGSTGAELARNEGPAYHLYILRDGAIHWALGQAGFDLAFELAGQHAVGYNAHSIAIAVMGCFDSEPDGVYLRPQPLRLHPTQAQLNSLELVCTGLCWWFNKQLMLSGHTELPGATRYPGKRCPGRNLDMDALRKRTGLQSLV